MNRTPEKKKPTKRWDNVFKAKWTADHEFIKVSRRGEKHAFCELCRSDFSICHGGQNDVDKHIATEKHKSNAMAVKGTTLSVMNMFVKKNQSTAVINAELLFQGMVIEHNLPLALNDHYSKLVSRMSPDSEIARQYACGRTKATHIAYSVASHSVDRLKKAVGLKKAPYSLATDGSSDEEDKFFPVLITHVDEGTGRITT
ncbi:6-phosphogluconate dehydrogenase decarboxylating [Dissostichus eleginoides]|uniref:6-phosphogluconate dehydrogenase decarboxylating n=1 Tax=Dissostichus eleginoides TaxID=100907 RepID=A0AAD9CMJ2_DISEL|nr:6-phosphogluconate dehydrogenase decarboxylating [Dissostichus eleginoides]